MSTHPAAKAALGDGEIPSRTPSGEAPQNAPNTASVAAGAYSYVKAEQTAKGFRLSACVVPGTTSRQMVEAGAILLGTLEALVASLPTEPVGVINTTAYTDAPMPRLVARMMRDAEANA